MSALRELNTRMTLQAMLALRLSLADANRAVPHASGPQGNAQWKAALRERLAKRNRALCDLWRGEGRFPWPEQDDENFLHDLTDEQAAGRNWIEDDRVGHFSEDILRSGLTLFKLKADVIAMRSALIANFPLSAKEWERFATDKRIAFPLHLAWNNPSFPVEIAAAFALTRAA